MFRTYMLTLADGETLRFQGYCHAETDNDFYEKLKLRMRKLPLDQKEAEEAGTTWQIFETSASEWYLVTVHEIARSDRYGVASTGIDESISVLKYETEEDLLEYLRSEIDTVSTENPFVRLIQNWERSDLFDEWGVN